MYNECVVATFRLVMRIVGVFEFLLAFLYFHYIDFPDKHKVGLRLGVMQYTLLALVSAYRVFGEETSDKNKTVAMNSLIIQGVFLVISVVGMTAAPSPPKRKTN
jgi:hypothetical protein